MPDAHASGQADGKAPLSPDRVLTPSSSRQSRASSVVASPPPSSASSIQPALPQPPQLQAGQSGQSGAANNNSTSTSANNNNRGQQVMVEMETVPSVTTLGVNPNSTLRVKRSQDSVPRVNSTKAANKKRSQRLAQGSKADIFAAKVANAVEEQDSSDDETFVYQAPIAPPHGADSLRRSFMRAGSISSTQPSPSAASYMNGGDGYFTDYVALPVGPESHTGDNATLVREQVRPGYDEASISPTKVTSGAHNMQLPSGTSGSSTPAGGGSISGSGGSGAGSSSGGTPSAGVGSRVSHHQQLQLPRNNASFRLSRTNSQPSQLTSHHATTNNPPLPSSSSMISPYPYSREGDFAGYDDASRESLWPQQQRMRQTSRSRIPQAGGDLALGGKDPNESIRAKHLYLMRWRVPNGAANQQTQFEDLTPEETQNERASLLKGRPSLHNYQSRNSYSKRRNHKALSIDQTMENAQGGRFMPHGYRNGNPGSLQTPQSQTEFLSDVDYSPTDTYSKYHSSASFSTRIVIAATIFLISLLSVVFVGGVLLAAARPLSDFDVVALSDVFVSDRELVFSLITHARNPGIFSRIVDHGELDVFATSSHATTEPSRMNSQDSKGKARTVLLGTITELESPMLFNGGLSSGMQWRSASAKLVNPLANNTDLWSEITSYEFDLTVKGILRYSVLGGERRESVSQSYHAMSPGDSD